MSYDIIVYTQSSRFPDPVRLGAELSARAPGLSVPPSLDLRSARGYVPIASTGFAVTRWAITEDQIEDHKQALRDAGEPDDEYLGVLQASDTCVTFRCNDDQEISAARWVAGAIATLSGGFVCDPQEGVTVQGGYLPDRR